MRIYFSTTSHDIPKARTLMRRITDAGHTITYDWTEGFDREPEMTEAELTARAIYDIDGVRQADAVIVYMQPKMHTAMTGAAIETGAALVLRTPVIVVEEEVTFDHFFQHHTAITKVPTMQTALDMLASYQR